MTDTFRDLIIRTSKDKEEAEFRIALHEALAEFAFDKNEEGKMVDDLVKRLRKNVMCGDAVIEEAANRIEKLETALRVIIQEDALTGKTVFVGDFGKIAIAALREKE